MAPQTKSKRYRYQTLAFAKKADFQPFCDCIALRRLSASGATAEWERRRPAKVPPQEAHENMRSELIEALTGTGRAKRQPERAKTREGNCQSDLAATPNYVGAMPRQRGRGKERRRGATLQPHEARKSRRAKRDGTQVPK